MSPATLAWKLRLHTHRTEECTGSEVSVAYSAYGQEKTFLTHTKALHDEVLVTIPVPAISASKAAKVEALGTHHLEEFNFADVTLTLLLAPPASKYPPPSSLCEITSTRWAILSFPIHGSSCSDPKSIMKKRAGSMSFIF